MANQEEVISHAALFPPPPPFFKNFTTENLSRLKELKEAAGIGKAGGSITKNEIEALRLLDLPPELRYLIPPALPVDGRYRGFGEEQDIHGPPLKVQNTNEEHKPTELQLLYPTSASESTPESDSTLDRAKHLRRMVQGLLLNFLELTGIFAQDSSKAKAKLEQLNTILLNAHQLVNDYRPHQARETLIMMMEDQLERKKAEVEGIRKMRDKIDDMLDGLGQEGLERAGEGNTAEIVQPSQAERARQAQKEIWHALEEELG